VLTPTTEKERYVPAAGRAWLTALYDPMMALTMRERAFRRALVAAVLAERPPAMVLDVGCGTGTLAAELAAADSRIHVLGIDGDEHVLTRARSKTEGFGERVRLARGLADAIPAPDTSADVVVASLLLHHLAPDAKLRALREAHRVLRPGGRLVVVDWGRPHDVLMRSVFSVLQLLDGFQSTRDHAAGRIPALIETAGFGLVTTLDRWRTAWGSLELITARANAQRSPAPR
jgi:ubiquinone/menaquinone biosynthesis C-methylase UbiE